MMLVLNSNPLGQRSKFSDLQTGRLFICTVSGRGILVRNYNGKSGVQLNLSGLFRRYPFVIKLPGGVENLGPSCSKLTMSLVNVSLKTLIIKYSKRANIFAEKM